MISPVDGVTQPRAVGRWAVLACVAWETSFAALHFAWAAGSRIGLGTSSRGAKAFSSSAFLAYDVVAGMACAVAVVITLATLWPLLPAWQRTIRRALTVGALLCLVRGAIGVIQVVAVGGTADDKASPVLYAYDPWFLLGAVLLGLTVLRLRRTPRLVR